LLSSEFSFCSFSFSACRSFTASRSAVRLVSNFWYFFHSCGTQTPKENTPEKKARQERNKTGCGVMVRRGRVNYLRAARVGAAYAGYGGRGGGGRGRELSILRGGGLLRFPRHGAAARVRWRGKV